jgi:hypothetical protein
VCWEFWRNAERSRIPPIAALVSTFIVGFGGSTIAAMMLGKPLGVLQGNVNIPVYSAVAMLVYYFPSGVFFRALEVNRVILAPLLTVVEAVSKAGTISKVGVDGVLGHASGQYSDSIFAAIVVGTVSGCGGGVLGSLMNLRYSSWSFGTPAQFVSPNKSMVLSFVSSIAYLCLYRTPVVARTSVGMFLAMLLDKVGIKAKLSAPLLSEAQVMGLMVAMIWLCNNETWACNCFNGMCSVMAKSAKSSAASPAAGKSPARKAGVSRGRRASPKRKGA